VTATVAAPRRAAAGRSLPPGLGRYVLTRLIAAVGVLVVLTIVVFLFIHAAPGGPENAIAGDMATPQQLQAIRVKYHLSDPLWTQYFHYVNTVVHGDFGTSVVRKTPVLSTIGTAAGITVPLMLMTWALSTVIGVALGILTASRAGGIADRLVLALTTVGASAPAFAVGTLFAWLFGIKLGWFPVVGDGNGGLDTLRHLVLPAATGAVVLLASITRFSRVRVAQILEEDQTTFARARGLSRAWVLRNVILRNAGVQIITVSSGQLVILLAWLVIIEQIFSLQGMGTLLVESVTNQDITVVQGITLFAAIFVVVVNLLTDLACMLIDPRLRAELERRR